MRAENIYKISLSALFTAIIAICSWLCIQLPSSMPVTLQVFAVALSGFFLGIKLSSLSVLAYILLGAVGIPVFSSFTGGISCLTGPTGGFIIGFIPLSILCGLSIKTKSKILKLFLPISGIIICHAFGIAQYAVITKTSPFLAFLVSSAPYIIKDVILIFGAFFLSLRLKKVNKP